jgi:anaerobic ribonucleoside-triphosphate reductase activating protein
MNYILEALGKNFVDGFTILGGDPFEPENQFVVVDILSKVRDVYPYMDIWVYTGYLYDVDLVPGGKVWTEVTDEILSYIDTLVDGPFIEEEKDITLQFRGSKNQRIITFGVDVER